MAEWRLARSGNRVRAFRHPSQVFSLICLIVGSAATQNCGAGTLVCAVLPCLRFNAAQTYKDVHGQFYIAIVVISFVVQLALLVTYLAAFDKLGKFPINWWKAVRVRGTWRV